MKIKKVIAAAIVGAGILCMAASAGAAGISVYVDNDLTTLIGADGNVVEPFIQDGTTFAPLRGVSEALGFEVLWDGDNKSVLIYDDKQPTGEIFRSDDDYIKVYIDDEYVDLKDANGGTVRPLLINGTTYIPLRGISQALNCFVRWNGSEQSVSIFMNTVPPDGIGLAEVPPYETNYVGTFYESVGDRLEMDKSYYTNALRLDRDSSYALFNLNSKFSSMTCVIGHTGGFEYEKSVAFIVDGKNVYTHELAPNAQDEVTIPLNKGLQLRIDSGAGEIGLGNIVFH